MVDAEGLEPGHIWISCVSSRRIAEHPYPARLVRLKSQLEFGLSVRVRDRYCQCYRLKQPIGASPSCIWFCGSVISDTKVGNHGDPGLI